MPALSAGDMISITWSSRWRGGVGMASRLDDIPVYEQRPLAVAASDYNRVQIALKRLGAPLQLSLPGLRSLELVLEHDSWIVIDASLNEIPVIAWTDFQVEHRANLHEPVPCRLKIYHAHALLIIDRVTALKQQALAARLAIAATDEGADKVIVLGDKIPHD